uniref:OSJNBb0061C13.7 protein n=6 Tax=Oryza TaxID=4527 RepID=Q7F927_ORYSJ|nr:OSJNBb0061C13.7 [Oryza sativa Japonica Group]CAH67325.1 OSIGBa0102I15.5 [Oryza sativa]
MAEHRADLEAAAVRRHHASWTSHSPRQAYASPSPPAPHNSGNGDLQVSGSSWRMNWIGRKIHIYNVTVGLYMLDWWERYLFNILMLCLLWYILRYVLGFFQSNLKTILQGGNYLVQGRKLHCKLSNQRGTDEMFVVIWTHSIVRDCCHIVFRENRISMPSDLKCTKLQISLGDFMVFEEVLGSTISTSVKVGTTQYQLPLARSSFRSVNLSHCDDGAKLPAAATSLAIRDGEPHRCRWEVAPLAIEGLARPSSPAPRGRGSAGLDRGEEEARGAIHCSASMFELVISIPAILLVLVIALGCYLLGRNRGRAEAASPQQFAPPAPPQQFAPPTPPK